MSGPQISEGNFRGMVEEANKSQQCCRGLGVPVKLQRIKAGGRKDLKQLSTLSSNETKQALRFSLTQIFHSSFSEEDSTAPVIYSLQSLYFTSLLASSLL